MKRLLAALSLLCLSVLPVGCSGVDVLAAEDIRDELVQSMHMGNIETYHIDMTMNTSVHMSIPNEELGEGPISTTIVAAGVVDNKNLEMMMEMWVTTDMLSQSDVPDSMVMAQYLISDVYYVKTDMPSEGETWLRYDIPEEFLQGYRSQMGQMEQQIDLLEYADVELLGTEMVNGIECYVLDVQADFAKLFDAMLQQPEIGNMILDDEYPAFDEFITDYSYKSWVSKDEHFLIKCESGYRMHINSESMGLPPQEAFDMTMEAEATVVLSNHNQPVCIQLPPEALGAEEASLLNSDTW